MNHACHFCDGDHPLDEASVGLCRPKKRFKGAFEAVLREVSFGHPANCDCDRCTYARVQLLGGRIHFLGEPPDPDYTAALLRRIGAQGWPA